MENTWSGYLRDVENIRYWIGEASEKGLNTRRAWFGLLCMAAPPWHTIIIGRHVTRKTRRVT